MMLAGGAVRRGIAITAISSYYGVLYVKAYLDHLAKSSDGIDGFSISMTGPMVPRGEELQYSLLCSVCLTILSPTSKYPMGYEASCVRDSRNTCGILHTVSRYQTDDPDGSGEIPRQAILRTSKYIPVLIVGMQQLPVVPGQGWPD